MLDIDYPWDDFFDSNFLLPIVRRTNLDPKDFNTGLFDTSRFGTGYFVSRKTSCETHRFTARFCI